MQLLCWQKMGAKDPKLNRQMRVDSILSIVTGAESKRLKGLTKKKLGKSKLNPECCFSFSGVVRKSDKHTGWLQVEERTLDFEAPSAEIAMV